MNYTIKELEQEVETWFVRRKEDIENVLQAHPGMNGTDYELPDFDRATRLILAYDIPTYYRLVHEGMFSNAAPDLVSGLEAIEIIALSHEEPPLMRHIYDSAMARNKLFEDVENLSISELALLANVEERTVRNAAASGQKTLKTIKVGSSTMITPEEANRWLSGRRGYRPTQFYDDGMRINLYEELMNQIESKGWTLEDTLKAANIDYGKTLDADKFEGNIEHLKGIEFIHLASSLGLHEMHFVSILIANINRDRNTTSETNDEQESNL